MLSLFIVVCLICTVGSLLFANRLAEDTTKYKESVDRIIELQEKIIKDIMLELNDRRNLLGMLKQTYEKQYRDIDNHSNEEERDLIKSFLSKNSHEVDDSIVDTINKEIQRSKQL